MKVLHVVDGYPPVRGGTEQAVRALVTGLAAAGHDVQVVTLARPGIPDDSFDGPVRIRRLRGTTHALERFGDDPEHLFHPTAVDPVLLHQLRRIVDEFAPDIVHAHGWIMNTCLSLRFSPQTSLVATLHDHGAVCAKRTMVRDEGGVDMCAGPSLSRCIPCARGFYGLAKGTALVAGLAERRRRLSRVDRLLPISEVVATTAAPFVDSDKVTVIPSFVSDDVFDEARLPAPAFLPTGDFLLFVGALGVHKGVDLLLEAHRRMRHRLPLVLIGMARPDTPDLSGTPDRPVLVKDAVPHGEIMASCAAAAAVVVPSRWPEPLGLVAVEAMASGSPVVVSDAGALPDVVGHGEAGVIVARGDAAALAEALDAILDDPDHARELGHNGIRRAADFTAASVIPRVEEVYRVAREVPATAAVVTGPNVG